MAYTDPTRVTETVAPDSCGHMLDPREALPVIGAVAEGGGYAVKRDKSTGYVVKSKRVIAVPTDDTDRSRRIRLHEMAHIAISPERPGSRKGIRGALVQRVEDMRCNLWNTRCGHTELGAPIIEDGTGLRTVEGLIEKPLAEGDYALAGSVALATAGSVDFDTVMAAIENAHPEFARELRAFVDAVWSEASDLANRTGLGESFAGGWKSTLTRTKMLQEFGARFAESESKPEPDAGDAEGESEPEAGDGDSSATGDGDESEPEPGDSDESSDDLSPSEGESEGSDGLDTETSEEGSEGVSDGGESGEPGDDEPSEGGEPSTGAEGAEDSSGRPGDLSDLDTYDRELPSEREKIDSVDDGPIGFDPSEIADTDTAPARPDDDPEMADAPADLAASVRQLMSLGYGSDRVPLVPMRITEPPRPLRLPGQMVGRTRKPTDLGVVPRYINRWATDRAVFEGRGQKPGGGAVLIDVSGSMHLEAADVERILMAAPAAIVAVYCGIGATGELRIVARNGKRVRSDLLTPGYGGNVVDIPALEWLAKQPGPRFWVCDGLLTGSRDSHLGPKWYGYAAKLCLRYKIMRYRRVSELETAMEGRKGARRARRHMIGGSRPTD